MVTLYAAGVAAAVFFPCSSMRARMRSAAASSFGSGDFAACELMSGTACATAATARATTAAVRSVIRSDCGAARKGQAGYLVLGLHVDRRLRHQADLGVQRLVPRQLLARVGGVAPHDRKQRAGREVEIVVLRLAGPDRGEQHVVL